MNQYTARAALIFVMLAGFTFGDIYKYLDENGNWAFTDKKPVAHEAEEIQLNTRKPSANKPIFTLNSSEDVSTISVNNIYFSPIQVALLVPEVSEQPLYFMVPPNTTQVLFEAEQYISDYEHYFSIGDPSAKPAQKNLLYPIAPQYSSRITQGFHGKFSHYTEPNVYAVDIGTRIATPIRAARRGTVIWVKDNYHLGAAKQFFLDKANFIYVLHDDGGFAVYAHILKGSAEVQPGETINEGDVLAKTGTSGYSTGPHLHFVVWHNANMATRSVPFTFYTKAHGAFEPTTDISFN